MSRSCDDSLIQLYVDGELEPAEQLVVGEHIRGCPVCRQRLMAYKSLFWDLSRPGPDPEPPPGEQFLTQGDQLMAAWEQEVADRRPNRTPGRVAWDLSTVGLRSSPVGEASASVLKRIFPGSREPAPGKRPLLRAGRTLVRLLGKGVKHR